ncbi:LLM class flavin-dependent oxidoreductase [Actinosynnema sp. NPDC020468]|uniref:LLM class flavin-dependent oxidoreductase n=1 Tax=Actinosynnema sp. NPDC020468 TaxID=3154488 RepID=UPI0033CAC2A0
MPKLPLSVLDTVPVFAGAPVGRSLHEAVRLARAVEGLGLRRYWVAEHHNTPTTATSSPAVLISQLAQATEVLRIGSGGVMLPNHAPLVVAEQFNTLSAFHPGRIDLGVGRAPGADPETARALRRDQGADFGAQVEELLGYLEPGARGVVAVPPVENPAPMLILGSSESSAELAGRLGLAYAFAHHIRPDLTERALSIYRDAFEPSARRFRPHAIVAGIAIVADTDERADELFGPLRLGFLRPGGPFATTAQAAAHPCGEGERARADARFGDQLIGGIRTVRDRLDDLVRRVRPDELMALTVVDGFADRLRSYELLARLVDADVTARTA